MGRLGVRPLGSDSCEPAVGLVAIPGQRDGIHSLGEQNQLVLVVEDADDVRELVHSVLENAGFGVAEAADGHAALRQFHRLRPDVVVLDVGLPELGGWEVVERIPVMTETPLLMLTALGTERDKIRVLDGGADDYLVKPFGTRRAGFPGPRTEQADS